MLTGIGLVSLDIYTLLGRSCDLVGASPHSKISA